MTDSIARQERIRCELVRYDSGKPLLAAMEEGENFHLLLLDVMMPFLTRFSLICGTGDWYSLQYPPLFPMGPTQTNW